MKKLAFCLMATGLLLTTFPFQAFAETEGTSSTLVVANTKEAAKAKAEALTLRLKEIKAMDKTDLTSSEKANLRSEVTTIKQELRHTGGGIYLSVGAIIIIVLLLIILL